MNRQKWFSFPFRTWLITRTVICVAMLIIAPLLPAPSTGIKAQFGWDVFFAWDSHFYYEIAASGYEHINNQAGANVAFFPLFPLLVHLGINLGITGKIAGLIINNLSFLIACLLLYDWIEKTEDTNKAKWVTLVFAWCPLSLFGTVFYTEGLFLCFSIAALRAFDRKEYLYVGLFGLLATATRITGLALIPAFMLVCWQEKRPLIAYIASLATSLGAIFYSIYCWYEFNNPLAFINVQHEFWERQRGIDWQGWWKMLMQITIGNYNWQQGKIVDWTHPLLFTLICAIAFLLFYFRKQLGENKFDYGFCFLMFLLWILAGDPLLNTIPILGGIYLLWYLRSFMSKVALIYGFCGLGLLITSGGTISLNRLAYGIAPLSIGLGILLSRNRRWGYSTMGFFGLLLILFSIRFAQELWVA